MIVAGPDFRVPPDFGTNVVQQIFILLALQTLLDEQATYGESMITLTSWYRDAARNAAVGGVSGSLHTRGLALDFTSSDPVTVGGVLSGAACGVGSLFGLCKPRPAFSKISAWKRLAPPFTQAVLERNGSYHYELDLT